MKVFYINDFTNTVISLNELNKISSNTKISSNYNDREILYSVEDVYKCRDWKVYTIEENSLSIDDVRDLMGRVDKNSDIYNKLKIEENRLLNIWVEDISSDSQLERSLF